jgi:hypothetical protein
MLGTSGGAVRSPLEGPGVGGGDEARAMPKQMWKGSIPPCNSWVSS